jgi:hypothetical protein
VRLSPLGTSATNWPILPAPDDRWWVWSSRWDENWQEKLKNYEKTCPCATLSTKNPTWPHLGSNTDHRCEKSPTNRLSCGTVPLYPPPIGQDVGWTPEPVWRKWRRENSWPYRDSNSDSSVIQLVASRCTGYATATPEEPLSVHPPLWSIYGSHRLENRLNSSHPASGHRILAKKKIRRGDRIMRRASEMELHLRNMKGEGSFFLIVLWRVSVWL